jgi:hypothetical protein
VSLGFDSLSAITKFKSGTTPLEAVEYLNVGREQWHEGTRFYLTKFIPGGRSVVRFVMGEYGEGKTHFLFLTAKTALDNNFIVSYVTAEDARLDKFDTVYRYLVSTMRTREMVEQEGLDFRTSTNGLKQILDGWFRENMEKLEAEVGDRFTKAARLTGRMNELIADLDEDKTWDPDFRSAVQTYFQNHLTATQEAADQNEQILDWLRGQPLKPMETRKFNVSGPIKADNARDKVRSLVQMLRALGRTGLVVLFDEVERIHEQSKGVRGRAYQTLRQLLDNADAAGTQYCYFLCAITREMLTSEKGFKEYDALWERVKIDLNAREGEPFDKRGLIVDLERTPFGRNELRELALKIREIHADAYNWDAALRVNDQAIDAYVDQVIQARGGLSVSVPRLIVKTITDVLEKAEQSAEFDPSGNVRGEVASAVRSLDDEVRTKIWE